MENKINLDDLRRLSIETKFPQDLLEKDYHLTKILHKIAEKQIKDLVFKRGTCLNKCYLGFYRLSEDLDFVYNKDTKELSKRQIKQILDKLRRELIEILDELTFQGVLYGSLEFFRDIDLDDFLGNAGGVRCMLHPSQYFTDFIIGYPAGCFQGFIAVDTGLRNRLNDNGSLLPANRPVRQALCETV